jgi:sporulation protein YqfC
MAISADSSLGFIVSPRKILCAGSKNHPSGRIGLLPKGGIHMAEEGRWKERLRQQLARSQEPIPGLPLVEIAGQNRVLIENHRGVCCYDRNQIRVRVSYGELSVLGYSLQLIHMSKDTVVITGRIDSICLHREVKP